MADFSDHAQAMERLAARNPIAAYEALLSGARARHIDTTALMAARVGLAVEAPSAELRELFDIAGVIGRASQDYREFVRTDPGEVRRTLSGDVAYARKHPQACVRVAESCLRAGDLETYVEMIDAAIEDPTGAGVVDTAERHRRDRVAATLADSDRVVAANNAAAASGDRGAITETAIAHARAGRLSEALALAAPVGGRLSAADGFFVTARLLRAHKRNLEVVRLGHELLDAGVTPKRVLDEVTESALAVQDYFVAAEDGRKAMEFGSRRASRLVAEALVHLDRPDEARAVCAAAVRKGDPEPYRSAARAFRETGDEAEAQYCERVVGLGAVGAATTRGQAGKVGVDASIASSRERSTGAPTSEWITPGTGTVPPSRRPIEPVTDPSLMMGPIQRGPDSPAR